MSLSLLSFDTWPSSITLANVPANNNARRVEVLAAPAISATTTAQPASPDDLDLYIIPAAATGAQWGGFEEGDLAQFKSGSWTAYAPYEGLRKFVIDEAEDWQFTTAWAAAAGGGGGGTVNSVNGQTGAVVLTEDDLSASIETYTASQTALITDKVVQMNVGTANDYTIPPNADVGFPVGCSLEVWQQGAGQTTIVAGAGVSILRDADDTLKLKAQNAGCSLRKVATNTWRLIGKMEAV